MRPGSWRMGAAALAALTAWSAGAQTSWVDPPAEALPQGAGSDRVPPPNPPRPARPEPLRRAAPRDPDDPVRSLTREARGFAVEYLESWSSRNGTALAEAGGFYGDRVVFHGREMSARDLIGQKRRFAGRWPIRNYRARDDTMRVTCDADRERCTIRLAFDFSAESPDRGRRSDGSGVVELDVAFEDGIPRIVEEDSWVTGRGRSDRTTALEELPD